MENYISPLSMQTVVKFDFLFGQTVYRSQQIVGALFKLIHIALYTWTCSRSIHTCSWKITSSKFDPCIP